MDVIRLPSMTLDTPRFMTAAEVMRDMLRIRSRVTLAAYEAEGLPFHQIRPRGPKLYDPAEVAAWIDSRCTTRSAGDAESVA